MALNKKSISAWYANYQLNSISGKQKMHLFDNLALLLIAGADIRSALTSLGKEFNTGTNHLLIQFLDRQLSNGKSLSEALEAAKILPEHLLMVIRLGESSGQLSQSLEMVSKQKEKEAEFKGKVLAALLYPIIIFAVLLVVATVVSLFILPKLAKLYTDLKVPLPTVTVVMISVGQFLEAHGTIAIPVMLAILGLGIYILFLNSKTKFLGQMLMFHIGPLHNIVQEVELAKFGFVLGSLIEGGFPLKQALRALADSATFYAYKSLYEQMYKNVSEGYPLQKAFGRMRNINRALPLSFQQMLISAEQSGTLSQVLIRMGEMYEKKNETSSKNLATLIEPIMLIIIWVFVAAFALSIILPIYSFVGNLNTLQ